MTAARWEAAEEEVLALVREYFPSARRSSGSGSTFADGDIVGVEGAFIEIKHQSRGVGFTIKKGEWEKTCQQALKWQKEPVLIVVNKTGSIVVTCNLGLLLLGLSHIPSGEL